MLNTDYSTSASQMLPKPILIAKRSPNKLRFWTIAALAIVLHHTS